ncbi:sulfite reductase, putative [Talaromyces marneffei ATCC 18224]|uniref:Sulfite reductase, putative n=1 Tax=Talaromyces marneffei (strain ATCC 18224 / CBS 334.59 / QM 7333) TaxID=441960 RepID=B6QFT8_TALMQ|nr:sulfite reductase, putative [Talaromyces marneffei ATCC 18224]
MTGSILGTNPVLSGDDFIAWHHAIGGELTDIPEDSWRIVLKEKHNDMLHLLKFPYNGQPPKRLVTSKAITPNPLHFVRNHGGIPIINKKDFTLTLDGLVANPKKYTLDDIMDESRFPQIVETVTIQCSGTRRIEQIGLYPGQGDEIPQAPWAEGAIGTATYRGISPKKLIKDCGGLVNGGKHLELYGAETVPWSKLKANEVLLTWEMNGEPLPAIHGYPLCVVVMGYIGARSVKWLYRIKAIETTSIAPVQSREPANTIRSRIQIQEMPVSSAIMSPWKGYVIIHNGKIHFKGWAYSGGGRWPERIELSSDGGFSWHEPLTVRSAWNWGLHVTSPAHRIAVYSINRTKERTKERLAALEREGIPLAPITRYEYVHSHTDEEIMKFYREHDPRDADNL